MEKAVRVDMLDFDFWTILFSVINILVLFFFLKKFLFGRVNAMLEKVYECRARGLFRNEDITPLAGDMAVFETDGAGGYGRSQAACR